MVKDIVQTSDSQAEPLFVFAPAGFGWGVAQNFAGGLTCSWAVRK